MLQDFCYEAPVPAEGADAQANSNNVNIMSHRCAAMAYMSIMTGYCMGLALIHAGTGSLGIKNALCTVLKMMIRLRGGRLNRMQKQRAVLKRNGDEVESLPNYSTIFIKACTEKSSKILVEMLFSCVALAAGIVMSGTGIVAELCLNSYYFSYKTVRDNAVSMTQETLMFFDLFVKGEPKARILPMAHLLRCL